MKADVKKKWLKALRSGKYKQTKKFLRTEDGFCCLGVLCDIASKEGIGKWDESPFINRYRYVKSEEDEQAAECMLPRFISDWSGISNQRPDNPTLSGATLSTHNDNGKSFNEIADLIERWL